MEQPRSRKNPAVEMGADDTRDKHLLLTANQAAALCNVSLRTWRAWDAAGKIPRPVRIGRKVFWRPEELRAWVAAECPDRVTWEPIREL